MKLYSQLALVCFITVAYSRFIDATSTFVIERDIKDITDVLSQIQYGIDSLDTTVKAFDGNLAPLTSASQNLVSIINSCITTVYSSPDLSFYQALSLLQPVKRLRTHGQRLSNNLKAKRPAIETAKQCGKTRDEINWIGISSQNLIKTIVAKVPSLAQEIAASQAAGITDVLKEAAAHFGPGSCTDAV